MIQSTLSTDLINFDTLPVRLREKLPSDYAFKGKFLQRMKKVRKSAEKRKRIDATTETASFPNSVHTVAQMDISEVSSDVFTQYLTKQIKRSERLKERREMKLSFEKKLRRFGFIEQADKLKKCSASVRVLVCAGGHSFRPMVDYRCYLPFCSDCWEVKSHRELSRQLPKVLQALKNDPTLIPAFNTLTIRSDKKRGLRGGCQRIKTDFRKLRDKDVWENCIGGIGRIENTFNHKHGWHPHLHNLLLLKDYIPQKELSKVWRGITKDSMIVDIRRVGAVVDGLIETIKYPFKPADLKKLGKAQIREMIDLSGERLGVSFGVIFGLNVDDDVESDLGNEYSEFVEETKKLNIGDCCPVCNSKLDLVDFGADGYASFLGSVPVTSARGKPS
jgi:hypothetical protein